MCFRLLRTCVVIYFFPSCVVVVVISSFFYLVWWCGYVFRTCVVIFSYLCSYVFFPSCVLVCVTYFFFSRVFDLVWVTYLLLVFGEQKMVQRVQEVVAEYDDRMRKMDLVPMFSYDRGLMRKDGAPNRMFLTFLFRHQELSIQFLKELGLIRSKVQCNICERDMTWTADLHRTDGFRWRCRKSVAKVRCRGTVVVIRSSRLMRARSVGASTIEGTLFRVSGCLAVSNEGPAEHFLFPYRTEPPTR